MLFEDESLTLEAKEEIVRSLRRTPSLFEQHLKYTRTGDVFVRRLVYHSTDAQPSPAPSVTIEVPFVDGQISAYFLPNINPRTMDVQVSIDFFGIDSISAGKFLIREPTWKIFPPRVKYVNPSTTSFAHLNLPHWKVVVVLDQNSIIVLPSDLSDSDSVTLPVITLIPWLALAEYAPISSSSVILLHDANTRKFVANHSHIWGSLYFQMLDSVLCNFVNALALNSSYRSNTSWRKVTLWRTQCGWTCNCDLIDHKWQKFRRPNMANGE